MAIDEKADGESPRDSPDRDTEALDASRMSVIEHLAELRNRLIKCVLAVAAGGVVAFIFYPDILEVLIQPYCDLAPDDDCTLYIRSPLDGFSVRLKVAGYGGIALAMPVLLWQTWRFITPGLYPRERRLAIPFLIAGCALFAMGAALAFWTIPRALEFLLEVGGDNLQALFEPNEYLSFVTFMMLAFGLGFEFPILLVFLQLAGILQPSTLARARRYAIVGIVVAVAIITPSGDPYSLMALSIPLWFFYEGSILAGKLIVRRRS